MNDNTRRDLELVVPVFIRADHVLIESPVTSKMDLGRTMTIIKSMSLSRSGRDTVMDSVLMEEEKNTIDCSSFVHAGQHGSGIRFQSSAASGLG